MADINTNNSLMQTKLGDALEVLELALTNQAIPSHTGFDLFDEDIADCMLIDDGLVPF